MEKGVKANFKNDLFSLNSELLWTFLDNYWKWHDFFRILQRTPKHSGSSCSGSSIQNLFGEQPSPYGQHHASPGLIWPAKPLVATGTTFTTWPRLSCILSYLGLLWGSFLKNSHNFLGMPAPYLLSAFKESHCAVMPLLFLRNVFLNQREMFCYSLWF